MKKTSLFFLFVLVVASFVFMSTTISALVFGVDFSSGGNKTLPASTFFVDSVTERTLKKVYADAKDGKGKVRILIVPGHDRENSGTQFMGLKEVELNLELGAELFNLLKEEPLFDVTLSQTKDGYIPELEIYFEKQKQEIADFIARQKGLMQKYVNAGKIHKTVGVIHNDAPNNVVTKLYGINKWANENGMDIVIHIHFNDYPGRRPSLPGKYSGFSIYVPESQYSNAKGSRPAAESIHHRLERFYAESNLPIEDGGIVEDQELIALGSNNTLDGAGLLIEYGYIYEPIFTEPSLRSTVIADLALQTSLGILDFFDESESDYDTRFLPFAWQDNLKKGENAAQRDVISLQAALMREGIYPPPSKNKNDCGLTGYFGPCTEVAVRAFQEKHDIFPAEGFVGEQTRNKLNELYGVGQKKSL